MFKFFKSSMSAAVQAAPSWMSRTRSAAIVSQFAKLIGLLARFGRALCRARTEAP
jgi:hypothetical protein